MTATCTLILGDGTNLTPDTYDGYSIQLDSESPDIPTEQATINTNIIKQPRKCSIDLIFTPWPQFENAFPQAGAGRPQQAVAALLAAWQSRQTCDLLVKGDRYSPCVLSIGWINDQTDTITIRCQVKELLIASSASVKLKPLKSQLKKTTGKKKVAVISTKTGVALFAVAHFAVGNWLGAANLAKAASVL